MWQYADLDTLSAPKLLSLLQEPCKSAEVVKALSNLFLNKITLFDKLCTVVTTLLELVLKIRKADLQCLNVVIYEKYL